MRLAAEALALPGASGIVGKLQLPVKLMLRQKLLADDGPTLLLGLGDIALPATLLALLLCHDLRRSNKHCVAAWAGLVSGGTGSEGSEGCESGGLQHLLTWRFWRDSYTAVAWGGYWVGIAAAFAAGLVFEAAQPAMLYLVPCCLAPVLAVGAARGELHDLWAGQRLSLAAGKESPGHVDV